MPHVKGCQRGIRNVDMMRWTRNVARWRVISPKCGNLFLFLPRVGEQAGPLYRKWVSLFFLNDAVSQF